MRLHTLIATGALALCAGVPAFAAPASTAGSALPLRDIAKLEATVNAYESEIAALHSHEALETLQAAYGYYFDKGQWRQVASLFATNATFEFGQRGV